MKAFSPSVLGLLGLMLPLVEAQADPYGDVVMRDKPFAYYRLNDPMPTGPSSGLSRPFGSGSLTSGGLSRKPPGLPIRDEMRGNNGVFVNGPATAIEGALASDPNNGALSFNRSGSQHIRLTEMGTLGKSMSSGFTVEYWLKVSDSTQYQTVHVYDPSGKTPEERVFLYVDGGKQAGKIFKGGDDVPASRNFNNPMALGAMNLRGKMEYFLQGSLDEVAIYKTPLAENQIAEHYRAALPKGI